MVLGDTAGATCARILPSMLFGRPPLLVQCVNLSVRLYYAAVQNLVYGCGNVPQTTAESSDTPRAAIRRYVHPASRRPTMRSPFKSEVVQLEYVPVGGAWVYPRVNVTNIVRPSKHHSYCLRAWAAR